MGAILIPRTWTEFIPSPFIHGIRATIWDILEFHRPIDRKQLR